MYDLFPLTGAQAFKLPEFRVRKSDGSDSYKSLFATELLALEVCAKRNLKPANYSRNADGSVTMSLGEVVLDAPSFYLFAHKALLTTLFLLVKSLPHDQRAGLSYKSFTSFSKDVAVKRTEIHASIYSKCGKDVRWAQKFIIDKRDDLVQHWQGNASNKFMPSVYAVDIPLLIYYDAESVYKLDEAQIDRVRAKVSVRTKMVLNGYADPVQKVAWMEAWLPSLTSQLQEEVETLLDNDIFISLPVTPQLVAHLDKTMANLLEFVTKDHS